MIRFAILFGVILAASIVGIFLAGDRAHVGIMRAVGERTIAVGDSLIGANVEGRLVALEHKVAAQDSILRARGGRTR